MVFAKDTTQDSTVTSLIGQLSADDAAARAAAAEKLVEMGRAGRDAVVAASHGDDPETKAQACRILLQLPWSQPADPPAVQTILDNYTHYTADQPVDIAPPGAPPPPPVAVAPPGPDNRKAAVLALADLPDAQGCDALIRLVYEDPDNSVRWTAVRALRTAADTPHLISLRRPDAPADDPPLAALYGLAWLMADESKAIPLLQQAVNAELDQPSEDGGELDFVVNCLVDLDEAQRKYDAAADLLRRELGHNPPTDKQGTPKPLLRLMALHADRGPLAGLDADAQLGAAAADDPQWLYAMARVSARQHNDKQAADLRAQAFNAGRGWRMGRYEVAEFLTQRGWNTEAEAEFRAFLTMPAGNDEADPSENNANAHFQLATLAVRRSDFFEAAEQEKSAVSVSGGDGLMQTGALERQTSVTEEAVWAEVHWWYLKAAMSRHDEPAISEQLEQVLRFKPTDEDLAIDVVPLLKDRKRAPEAEALFAAAHKYAQSQLDADPANAGLMNGLAWLDAKCDEDLPEADKLASVAVAGLPDDSAVIDTLAEVRYHQGRYSDAVKLETHALEITPGDTFMTGQLARFKAAADKPASRP